MRVVPFVAERFEPRRVELPAGGEQVVEHPRQEFVARRPCDLVGDVGNGLIDALGDPGRAAHVDADADDDLHRGHGAGEFDQDSGELAAVQQHVVRPFQLDAPKTVIEQRSSHRDADHQAQRADFRDGRFDQHADGDGQIASEGAEPGPAPAAAAGGLHLGGEHTARDRGVRGPGEQRRVGAVDMRDELQAAQPCRGCGRQSAPNRRLREQFDVVLETSAVVPDSNAHCREGRLLVGAEPGQGGRPTHGQLIEDASEPANVGHPCSPIRRCRIPLCRRCRKSVDVSKTAR